MKLYDNSIDGYKQKYNKYTQKIYSILKGGGFDDEEWFRIRINPTGLPTGSMDLSDSSGLSLVARQYEEVNRQLIESNKLGEGGQSSIYLHENPYLLIRTIEQSDTMETEIRNNLITSQCVIRNENPHFCVSYFFGNDKVRNVLQILEKMDGDVNKSTFTKEYTEKTFMMEQLMIGLYTLTKYKILNNDIKPQNVLYKKLTKPVMLLYKYDERYFSIETDTIYAFTDFGKNTNYKTDCTGSNISEKFVSCAKNLSDINSMSLLNGDMHRANYAFFSSDDIDTFLKINDYPCDLRITGSIAPVLATNGTRYETCIRKKLENLMTVGRLQMHTEIPVADDIPIVSFDLTM